MRLPPLIERLLEELQESGIRIGVGERLRLFEVLTADPQLALVSPAPLALLEPLLRAVIVKSIEEEGDFQRVFARWRGLVEADAAKRGDRSTAAPVVDRIPGTPPTTAATGTGETKSPPPSGPRHRARIAIGALAMALFGSTVLIWKSCPLADPPIDSGVRSPDAEPPLPLPDAGQLAEWFTAPAPHFEVTPPGRPLAFWFALGVAALALGLVVATWLVWRRRPKKWRPEPTPTSQPGGPLRLFPAIAEPPHAPLRLLDRGDEEDLVWGIGKFLAEAATPHLDMAATIAATTANGGLPELRFERARHAREVWLWVDEAVIASAEPWAGAMVRLADEIATSLQRAGLPVERASYYGLPERLWRGALQFAPNEVDEQRHSALVVLFTDGRVLTERMASQGDRAPTAALLRSLSGWPQLAFVDCSRGGFGLRELLRPLDLPVLAPEEVIPFLGGSTVRRRGRGQSTGGDATAWAAACALPPFPVDETAGFRIRDRLNLRASGWVWGELRANTDGNSDRLQWSGERRSELLRWLRDVSTYGDPESLLACALLGWRELLEEEEKQQRDSGQAWEGTAAAARMAMERALLRLWDEPAQAVNALYRLYPGALRRTIERQLATHAPFEYDRTKGAERSVILPWRIDSLPAPEQSMLLAMGFGRDAGLRGEIAVRWPGRVQLAMGLAGGLALASIGGAVARFGDRSCSLDIQGARVAADCAGKFDQGSPSKRARYVVASSRRVTRSFAPEACGTLDITWPAERQPCRVPDDRGTQEEWRCGSNPSPPRPASAGWPNHSVFTLAAPPTDEGARELAARLLDSGSADRVLLDPGAPRTFLDWTCGEQQSMDVRMEEENNHTPGADQVVRLQPAGGAGDWRRLAAALTFDGVKPLRAVWPEARLVGETGKEQLAGLGSGCRPGMEIVDQGMRFVHICGGEFLMGSTVKDKYAIDDEKPAHRVRVSDFWMGKFEVTNREFGRADKPAELPAVDVNWNAARASCRKLGADFDLPTEAEWEYAARAGTTTRYFFGDEERPLAEYAWFSTNSNELHTVGSKKPNPWGLHDIYGNASEWVVDCYHAGEYENRTSTDVTPDPFVDEKSCGRRVLRGGSFDARAFLRSALRSVSPPVTKDGFIGFRCVRGARRQR